MVWRTRTSESSRIGSQYPRAPLLFGDMESPSFGPAVAERMAALTVELQRVVSGVAFELLERIRADKSAP